MFQKRNYIKCFQNQISVFTFDIPFSQITLKSFSSLSSKFQRRRKSITIVIVIVIVIVNGGHDGVNLFAGSPSGASGKKGEAWDGVVRRRQDRQLLLTTSLFGDSLVSIKGRSLASSPLSSSSMSVVDRLMQEQRSRDAKKADAMLVLTQVAMPLRKSPAWGPRWWSWSGPRRSWRPGRWGRGRRCSVKT